MIVTGFHAGHTHKLTPCQKTANRALVVGQAPVEHGFAHLPRALLVLTNLEVNRRQTPRIRPLTCHFKLEETLWP
ncbi:hypothetical protein [Streptomyces klenkii]